MKTIAWIMTPDRWLLLGVLLFAGSFCFLVTQLFGARI
jgi:hypothetical protein